MITLFIIFLICCFACTGKRDVFVKDVFETDPETGELYPGKSCDECENTLFFCTGYVSEKHYDNAPVHYFPCDSSDPEQLKNLGISTEEYCDICEHPDACTHFPMKHVMLKDTDCLNCLAADYCKGIRYGMDPDNSELVCPHVKIVD